ncbi:Crp/Fnr family transcriptional regulator [Catalinimonas sp. 4WD22]|uniref:Crp/Fnr family transcriptional regulator n=1 Tax=Catalinimonas locisalis TaxID=3133978 RepID=UPI003100B45C
MNKDLVFANISKHIELTQEEREHVVKLFEECSLKKNEFILRQGDPCNYINFVNEGTLRAFFANSNGKESTLMFAVKDWWITDMYCFLNELPAMVSIQAVEKSNILKLSKKNLDVLFHIMPSFNTFFRILMQNAYCREQLRMIQNLSLPAQERYENFISKYPQIAKKIPLKHIASYLGVTPEFLSTVRANRKFIQ